MSDVRASDREREAATLRLRADHLEGRLSLDELEERVAAAQAAVTIGDLATLQQDLPERHSAPPPSPSPAKKPWIPGRRGFSHRVRLDSPPHVVREHATAYLVPALDTIGLRMQRSGPDHMEFSRGRDRATLRLQPVGVDGTLLIAHGHAPLAVRRAFAQLAQ